MPFEAAKALAANFCWEIRFALVPLFGRRFPEYCLRPDHPSYRRHVIHPDIIKQCKQEVEGWKMKSLPNLDPRLATLSSPTTPRASASSKTNEDWSQKTLRPRPGRLLIDGNGPAPAIPAFQLPSLPRMPQPNYMLERFLEPRMSGRASPAPSTCMSSATSSNMASSPRMKRTFSEVDDQESMSTTSSHLASQKRHKQSIVADEDAKAAYWLVQLSMDDGARR